MVEQSEWASVQILTDALREIRELVPSGSAEMACIDEALGKVGVTPWSTPNPEFFEEEANTDFAEDVGNIVKTLSRRQE